MNFKLYSKLMGYLAVIGIALLIFQITQVIRHWNDEPEQAPILQSHKLDDYTNVDRRMFTF